MEYRIETKPAFQLTGLPLRTTCKDGLNFQEIPAFWDRNLNDGTVAKLASLAPPGSAVGVAGVCAEFDLEREVFTYFIAIETPADRSAIPASCREIAVPPATWGVSDDVAQVSITSGSPAKPPGLPRCSSVYPSGTSVEGSTGSRSSRGRMGRAYSRRPSGPTGYHTGRGTPKNRWRLMHQSPARPFTQFS